VLGLAFLAFGAGNHYPSVKIGDVPHVRQKPDFCGEAAAESWLRKLGRGFDQDAVFDRSGMDPARGMGATTRELKVALERLGFAVGPVWRFVAAARAGSELEGEFAALHKDLQNGVPSIVCMHYDDSPSTTEHFRLVLGYDAGKDEVVYHEPAEDRGAYRRMSRQRFLSLWPLKYEAARWTVIRFALSGGPAADAAKHKGFSQADYAQHVMALKEKLPPGFSIVIEPPFVVVGDGGAESVRRHAEGTVRWAVDKLGRDFFARPPERILTVWLFKDRASYDHHNRVLFKDKPDTPYGYYSRKLRALVMNIGTGGGTLVHEIVHPYMEANVPDCPAWLNEGLGSLFEQSSEREGRIVGLTNWRLEGLQSAFGKGRVPSTKALVHTTDEQFYDSDTGYAQARYLLYYLQEKGLLGKFWRTYLAGRARDRSGWAALTSTLGEADMAAFDLKWKRFVLGLRFP
jgi:hypothetical protein